jgi:hypothetical protein
VEKENEGNSNKINKKQRIKTIVEKKKRIEKTKGMN